MQPVDGFRQRPLGFAYEQSLGLTWDLAFAYERSHTYCKTWHTHNRAMVLCPLGAAQVRLWIAGEAQPRRVTAEQLLYVAAQVEHQTEAEESIYDVLALYPADTMLRAWSAAGGALPPTSTAPLTRTPWFDALVQQFLLRRVRGAAAVAADVAAIEWLLVSAAFAPGSSSPATTTVCHGLAALLQAIDAQVAGPWSLDDLAQRAHTSRASVVRMFQRGLGMSPAAYVRQRRMEEAVHLLRHGGYAVSQVAERVGYTSQAAFATAFRRHVGYAPSALPAHVGP